MIPAVAAVINVLIIDGVPALRLFQRQIAVERDMARELLLRGRVVGVLDGEGE